MNVEAGGESNSEKSPKGFVVRTEVLSTSVDVHVGVSCCLLLLLLFCCCFSEEVWSSFSLTADAVKMMKHKYRVRVGVGYGSFA